MLIEREKLLPRISEIECNAPLELGNNYSDYNVRVFISDMYTEHISTLKKLEEISETSNQNFLLESLSGTVYERELTTKPVVGYKGRASYSAEYNGQFLIPWIVTARVADGEIFIDYQANLNRPDSTLSFKLTQTKRPVLYHPESYIYPRKQRKKRIKIDGLPIFLRVDEELPPNEPNEPSRLNKLSIIGRGIKPVQFTVSDDNFAKLEHDSEFQGRWYERWTFRNDGEITKLQDVVIGLTGKWVTQRNK